MRRSSKKRPRLLGPVGPQLKGRCWLYLSVAERSTSQPCRQNPEVASRLIWTALDLWPVRKKGEKRYCRGQPRHCENVRCFGRFTENWGLGIQTHNSYVPVTAAATTNCKMPIGGDDTDWGVACPERPCNTILVFNAYWRKELWRLLKRQVER